MVNTPTAPKCPPKRRAFVCQNLAAHGGHKALFCCACSIVHRLPVWIVLRVEAHPELLLRDLLLRKVFRKLLAAEPAALRRFEILPKAAARPERRRRGYRPSASDSRSHSRRGLLPFPRRYPPCRRSFPPRSPAGGRSVRGRRGPFRMRQRLNFHGPIDPAVTFVHTLSPFTHCPSTCPIGSRKIRFA